MIRTLIILTVLLPITIQETRRQISMESDRCCIIPICVDAEHCSDNVSCGYFCRTRPFQAVKFSPRIQTPGYKLKSSYLKEDCRFGECRPYYFDCTHCPLPMGSDFNINTVRIDCNSCYYQ